jgi:hypothetical protein
MSERTFGVYRDGDFWRVQTAICRITPGTLTLLAAGIKGKGEMKAEGLNRTDATALCARLNEWVESQNEPARKSRRRA